MTQGFQILHPMLYILPIMLASSTMQFLLLGRRKKGIADPSWAKWAAIIILVALCFIGVFAKF